MTEDDFLQDLRSAMDAAPDDVNDDDIQEEFQLQTKPKSTTALVLDDWSKRRGRTFSRGDDGQKVLQLPSTMDELSYEDREQQRELLGSDMLAMAWEPRPEVHKPDETEHPVRAQFLQALLEAPAYQKLHRKTRLDMLASEMAAGSFAAQYAEYVAEVVENPGADDLDREGDLQDKIDEATKEAEKDVKDLNDMRDSMMGGGIGGESGAATTMNTAAVKKMFLRIRRRSNLRNIMDLAGKYTRLAQSLQSQKPCHGEDETVGIELGNQISKVLPTEFALLGEEVLEYDFLRRYLESSLVIRETRSVESVAKGPIVVVVDESGSMSGNRVEHAKAIALSMLWVAEHQKRWCCLVGFSGGEDEGTYLVIEPGKRDPEALFKWIKHFYSNGTDMDVPLVVLPKKWGELGCPLGQTDIIQITDALVHVDGKVERDFNAWKKKYEVKMNTIVIGRRGKSIGDLERVSDRWFCVPDLNMDASGVAECLSV